MPLVARGRWRKRRRPARTLFPRTLRGRMIAGLVALLALGCATVGLVTYFAVQRSLARELNSELQTATGLAYNCWERQFSQNSGEEINDPGTAAGTPGAGQDRKRDGASGGEEPGITSLGSGQGTGGQGTGGQGTGGQGTGGQGTGGGATPGQGAGSAAAGGSGQAPVLSCQGLSERTFVAVIRHGQWKKALVGDIPFQLSAADRRNLLSIRPYPAAPPTDASQDFPTSTRYLSWAGGMFELTSIRDPDGDGSIYITGLPLDTVHDTLRDVALAEAVVFGVVLVLAGVLGTLWVRLSLRPLRRVAATASRVAELPLESGEVSLPGGVPDSDPATETGQVGLAFNRMLGHVQTALRRRAASEARLRRFAADASHELRTPLAAIRGYAELALLHPGDSPDAVTHALNRVLSESTRMSVLVDDLLLLARLDAGRPLNRERVDMTRLAIDATSDAQVARPGHRWVLELPDDPVLVRGDEHRLHQVLANLLSNAGRHTPDGTTVTVRVSGTLPDGEPGSGSESSTHGTLPAEPRLVLTVADDGPGIPPGLLPDLFERFTRADTSRSHATNASSTGLGLAIVDAVVAAHQGAVLVTSRPGMTRFTIALPRLGEPPEAQPQRRLRPAARTPAKS